MKYLVFGLILLSCLSYSQCSEQIVIREKITNKDPLCGLCEVSTAIIRYEVEFANNTLSIFEEIAKDLCYVLGGQPVYKLCDHICAEIQDIANWIMSGYTNKQICTKLHLCSNDIIKYKSNLKLFTKKNNKSINFKLTTE